MGFASATARASLQPHSLDPAGRYQASLRERLGFAAPSFRVLAGEVNQRVRNTACHVLDDLCPPARTRTWNNGSEDRCDIHFTTGGNAFDQSWHQYRRFFSFIKIVDPYSRVKRMKI